MGGEGEDEPILIEVNTPSHLGVVPAGLVPMPVMAHVDLLGVISFLFMDSARRRRKGGTRSPYSISVDYWGEREEAEYNPGPYC